MNIEIVKVGFLETNCYILSIQDHVLVIDPGADYDKINEVINNRVIDGVLITHNHFDHIGALEKLINEYKVEILNKDNLNEIEYKINNFIFKVIFTPGHTSDSICFYFEKCFSCFRWQFL